MDPHPRSPALMRVRAAVRAVLTRVRDEATREATGATEPLVLVGLSGGADSLALAAATALEAPRTGSRAGAVIVDHGLQAGSSAVADRAAAHARDFGLSPVVLRRARIEQDRGSSAGGDARVAAGGAAGGPEAVARAARYAEFVSAAEETGARWILTAHTRDDQAEQTLLALARGSGMRSLAGIPPERPLGGKVTVLRPLLAERHGITRSDTEAACADLGLDPWHDPHNADPAFLRSRVRTEILPLLEQRLGPGVATALARTADLVREDADALEALAAELARSSLRAAPTSDPEDSGEASIALDVAALATAPAALRQRAIRLVARDHFDAHLSRDHTLAVAALVTDWRGQGPIDVPGVAVSREGRALVFRAR